MTSIRYVAIGDSFSEGVGDELTDGYVRGWADLLAHGWAWSRNDAVSYANLAIRGKLVWEILDEQLEPALALQPTHLSFNGAGNDMLRPRANISHLAAAFSRVRQRCAEVGVTLIVLSGANPSRHLPLGSLIQRRGDRLSAQVASVLSGQDDVIRAVNWNDRELSTAEYWAADRLHMNARGHHRVAARVLSALGEQVPPHWWSLPDLDLGPRPHGPAYYREFVLPWVRRRLAGESSGDGVMPKHPEWIRIEPQTSDTRPHTAAEPQTEGERS